MRTLFINGTVGAGKTSLVESIGEELKRRGVPHAMVDLDELRRSWPAPEGDPFNQQVGLASLAQLAILHSARGARFFIVAGVLESAGEVDTMRKGLGDDALLVRLTVEPDEGERRLRARHRNDPEQLAWYLRRFGELDHILATATPADAVLDTTGRALEDLAPEVVGLVLST